MSRMRAADCLVSLAVAAYCEAIDVPEFDETAIASRHRARVHATQNVRSHRLRTAGSIAAVVALILVLYNVPAVVAGVQRILQGFTINDGRAVPMMIRAVSFERARADMPFAVIKPPPLAGAPTVTIHEMYEAATHSNPSVIFEIHGKTPGATVTIVESKATREHSRVLLFARGPGAAHGLAPLHSLERLTARNSRANRDTVYGSLEGRRLSPTLWVAHGTRIVLISTPGFLTTAQRQAVRRAMSR